MNLKIRSIEKSDTEALFSMMHDFYASDAVSTNGSPEIFENDVNECLSDSPFLQGYVFEIDGKTVGYAMIAHSFSTEFGKRCVWIEDIYIIEGYRSLGIASRFFDFIEEKHQDSLFRLEVEEENEPAFSLYKKRGFSTLPYIEMKK